MPKPLRERLPKDSIAEFRRAARQRYADGLHLERAGRPLAAVYLWGYAAEMVLKAGYFRAVGFARGRPISAYDLRAARAGATLRSVSWAGNWHDLRGWAELLVRTRTVRPKGAYRNTAFGLRVETAGVRLGRVWRETLRYHANTPYPHEVAEVRDTVGWLVRNALSL